MSKTQLEMLSLAMNKVTGGRTFVLLVLEDVDDDGLGSVSIIAEGDQPTLAAMLDGAPGLKDKLEGEDVIDAAPFAAA